MTEKKKKSKVRIAFWGIILAAAILAAAGYPMITAEYDIYSPKISGDICIAVVSDLHSCNYGSEMERLIGPIEKADPDIILLPGDIYDDILDNENARKFLKYAGEKYRCFYVTGNHEHRTGHAEELKEETEGYGIAVLDGSAFSLNINGNDLTVSGTDDPSSGQDNFERQLASAGDSVSENGCYNILISHRPRYIDKYLQYDFDLMVSGHAHGGQWRIPFLVNGIYSPDQGLFPKYAGGEYDFGEKVFIVSRGLAREKIPLPRFFNNAELVIIRLHGEEQQ
ncbi:MAG: metallophosphoesterase [Huintestinicola sp.]